MQGGSGCRGAGWERRAACGPLVRCAPARLGASVLRIGFTLTYMVRAVHRTRTGLFRGGSPTTKLVSNYSQHFFYIFLSIWVGWLHHGEPESPPLLSPRGWNWVHFLVFLTSNGTSASHTVCGHSNQLKVRYYWRKASWQKIIFFM